MIESLLPFEKIKRNVFVKRDSETSPKFGHYPYERPAEELINHGIINLDKPAGPTSHQVSAYVKHILGIDKAGHSGTLDPNVTGVLPVALGKGTKITHLLLTAGKEYVCVMHVHKEINEYQIRKGFEQFIGKISQLPPIRSAVKREWREREIYYLNILEIEEKEVLFRVGCQAGTYIRKLCVDIGNKLGTGAHMTELRRTKAGPFNEEVLATLQDVADAYHFYKNEGKEKYLRHVIQPIETSIVHLPKIWIMDSTVDSLTHGANLYIPGIAKFESGIMEESIVAVLTLKGELVCYGIAKMSTENIKNNEKGFVLKPERVFMESGIYPRIER